MVSQRVVVIAGIAVALAVSVVAGYLLLSQRESPEAKGLVVVMLTPGFEAEVRRLLASGDELHVIGVGGDPHELHLSPSDVAIIKRSSIIVTMGHTHIDEDIEELVRKGEVKARIVNIRDIEGLEVPLLPGGVRNYHELFYDPRNLAKILDTIAKLLIELRPEMKSVYESNLERVKADIERLISSHEGLLRGYKAVMTTAEIQPAIQWLGVDVIAYLVTHHDESPTPGRLDEALRALGEGRVIAFIAAKCSDSTCNPASPLDESLYNEARSRGAPVIMIPLGYFGESVVWKLEYIISQASSLKS